MLVVFGAVFQAIAAVISGAVATYLWGLIGFLVWAALLLYLAGDALAEYGGRS